MIRTPLALALACCSCTLAAAPDAGTQARKLLAKARALARDEKHAEAEKAYLSALSLTPPPAVEAEACAGLAEAYCNLSQFAQAEKFLARGEGLVGEGTSRRVRDTVSYLEAVLAWQRKDYAAAVAQLRKAIEASETVVLWANDDLGKYFADVVLMDEESKVRKEFMALTDTSNFGRELRASIRTACQKAAKEGKLVLLEFYGDWCPWCRDMKQCVRHPEMVAALAKFVVLRVDVGRFDRHQIVMTDYVDELSVPALVVLDASGRKLTHLAPASYEDRAKGRNDPQRLARLLNGLASRK